MASDPRFDTVPSQYDPDRRDETAGGRSKWATCLMGCLIALGIMIILAVFAGVWVSWKWRGWFADFGSQAINQGIDSSDLPAQEKTEVKAQVERVATALRDGQLSGEQARTIVEKLMHSPLMPTLVVAAVDKRYFAKSGLSDDEKAQGRQVLKRFARGMIDKKIDQTGIDAVMAHIADRQPDGSWHPRQQVSDQELRAALSEAKSLADAAGIPAEPQNIDPSDEVKRIIDEALKDR